MKTPSALPSACALSVTALTYGCSVHWVCSCSAAGIIIFKLHSPQRKLIIGRLAEEKTVGRWQRKLIYDVLF